MHHVTVPQIRSLRGGGWRGSGLSFHASLGGDGSGVRWVHGEWQPATTLMDRLPSFDRGCASRARGKRHFWLTIDSHPEAPKPRKLSRLYGGWSGSGFHDGPDILAFDECPRGLLDGLSGCAKRGRHWPRMVDINPRVKCTLSTQFEPFSGATAKVRSGRAAFQQAKTFRPTRKPGGCGHKMNYGQLSLNPPGQARGDGGGGGDCKRTGSDADIPPSFPRRRGLSSLSEGGSLIWRWVPAFAGMTVGGLALLRGPRRDRFQR